MYNIGYITLIGGIATKPHDFVLHSNFHSIFFFFGGHPITDSLAV